jgi:hypothetical protein
MIIDLVLKKISEPRRGDIVFLLFFYFLVSCTTPQQNTQTQVITINYSPFTEFQMDEVFACANNLSIILKVTDQTPEIYFQFGEPDVLLDFAYQINEEEIIVVVNKQNEMQNVSIKEIQNLFGTQMMQVWVYPSDSEMQNVLNQFVMKGRSVSSFANVVVSPKQAVEKIESESNAIGFIPKSLLNENLKEIYSIGIFPILALTETEPQGAVKSLLGCLQ